MYEKIDVMLISIVDRIETALPKTTSIDKIVELGNLLVEIKKSALAPKIVVSEKAEQLSEEI